MIHGSAKIKGQARKTHHFFEKLDFFKDVQMIAMWAVRCTGVDVLQQDRDLKTAEMR